MLRITFLLLMLAVGASFAQVPFRENKNWKLVDRQTLKPLINKTFSDMVLVNDSIYRVTIDEKQGLMKANGEWIIQPKYKYLGWPKNGYITFTYEGKVNAIQGEIVQGKWGIMDLSGKIVVEPEFHQIQLSEHNLAIVQIQQNWGDWGVIDMQGNWLEKAKYETKSFDMRPHSTIHVTGPNHVIYEKDKKFYIKNLSRKSIKKLSHSDFWGPWFQGEHAVTSDQNGSYLINYKGEKTSKYYDNITLDASGKIGGAIKDKSGYVISSKGIILGKCPGASVARVKNEFILFTIVTEKADPESKNYLFKVYDSAGNFLYETKDEARFCSSPGYTIQNRRSGIQVVANAKGHVIYESNEWIKDYFDEDHLALIKDENRDYNLVNAETNENLLKSPAYQIYKRKDGLYTIKKSSSYAYTFDCKSNKELLTYKPQYVKDFWRRKYGIKDEISGEFVIDNKYDQVWQINDSRFWMKKSNTWYVMDVPSKTIIDSAARISMVKKRGSDETKYWSTSSKKSSPGMVDLNGNRIIPDGIYDRLITSNSTSISPIVAEEKKVYSIFSPNGKLIAYPVKDPTFRHSLLYYSTDEGSFYLDSLGNEITQLRNLQSCRLINKEWMSGNIEGKSKLFNFKSGKVYPMPQTISQQIMLDLELPHFIFYIKKKGYGICDLNGKIIRNADGYNRINQARENMQVVYNWKSKEALVLIEENNKLSIEEHKYFAEFSKTGSKPTYLIGDGKKIFVADEFLNPINDLRFKDAQINGSFAEVKTLDGKWGVINSKGSEIIPAEYDEIIGLDVGEMICVKKDDDFYFFDRYGDQLLSDMNITKVNAEISEQFPEIVGIEINGEWVIYNGSSQKELIKGFTPIVDWDAFDCDCGVIILEKDDKQGLFNVFSKLWTLDPVYNKIDALELYDVVDGILFQVESDEGENLWDPLRKQLIFDKPVDKAVHSFGEGMFSFEDDGKHGFYGYLNAWTLIPATYELKKADFWPSDYCSYGKHVAVTVKKKSGLLGIDGKWAIQPEYIDFEAIDDFCEYFIGYTKKLAYVLKTDGTKVVDQGFDYFEVGVENDILGYGFIGEVEYLVYKSGKMEAITKD